MHMDNARKMIGKTVDISVTSVLQLPAGKMIFGKWDDRIGMRSEPRQPVAAVAQADRYRTQKAAAVLG